MMKIPIISGDSRYFLVLFIILTMVALFGPLTTKDCEPRQAWKGAAVTVNLGVEVWLIELPPFVCEAMSYLALARKWRPRTFTQLVGQDHINNALINSLTQNRLHHAYVFTGTRGVGKTSYARLLAKALNCEQGISADPCLECNACIAVEKGCFIDLIEIDGASKTKVEDTRELLQNVQYSPTQGRFKIYLIDEVHMLSQHSFNALLKTLEEPPAHVKFLLATTDPHKLPVTVLSRCLQFSLKHIAPQTIQAHLQLILTAEKLNFEVAALELIAKAAKGSMRDALSLLDQAIACCANHLSAYEVKGILGYTQQDYALQLLQALMRSDATQIIQLSRKITVEGGNFRYVLDELLAYLHQITVIQSLKEENTMLGLSSEFQKLAKQFSPNDTQLFYQIGLKGIDDMYLAPTLAIGFEMTLLRMLLFQPAPKGTVRNLTYPKTNNEICLSEAQVSSITSSSQETSCIAKNAPNTNTLLSQSSEDKEKAKITVETWDKIIKQLNLTGLALNAAENTEFVSKSGMEINLRISPGHQSLFSATILKRLEKALTDYYAEVVKIIFITTEQVQSSPAQQKQILTSQRQQQAESSLQEDSFFQQLKQEFSAEIIKDSIVPIKDGL